MFPSRAPTQISDTNIDASSNVNGPSRNLSVTCNSRKFAFANPQFQPNDSVIKFAEWK